MSWIKKTIIGTFGILSLVLCSAFVSSACYAIEDRSVIIDDSNYNSFDLNCGSDCSSYHYVLLSDLNLTGSLVYSLCPYSSSYTIRIVFTINSAFGDNFVFQLNSFDNADRMIYCSASWSSGTSFKLTFSENNPFGSSATGTINISENGEYDVSSFAIANVNVPPESIPGDYHDDLININNSILVCGAILLVIYFFYCIYRMIIRSSGVK